MPTDQDFMHRALFLAHLGAGNVAPNPLVGAVLVHDGVIIGEGWHRQYGGPHAEVNCLNSVAECNRHKISESILYVTLEPCAHYGKTPPCAELIVKHKITKVIIATSDSFKEVDGKGVSILKQAGVEVELGLLEEEARYQNRRFFTFHEKKRPFIILKWAQSEDGFIAPFEGKKVMISNKWARQYVLKMRSEEAGIMVGFQTALKDNPLLTNRFDGTNQPLRIVFDSKLELPEELIMKTDGGKTLIFNYLENKQIGVCEYLKIDKSKPLLEEMMAILHNKGINSLIVEGGTKTINGFLKANHWDETHIVSTPVLLKEGVEAPKFLGRTAAKTVVLGDNIVQVFEQNRL